MSTKKDKKCESCQSFFDGHEDVCPACQGHDLYVEETKVFDPIFEETVDKFFDAREDIEEFLFN